MLTRMVSFCRARDPPASASQSAGITGVSHRAQPFFFSVETEFHHIGRGGLELLTSSDPPALTSQSAGITGLSHSPRPSQLFFKKISKKPAGLLGGRTWFLTVSSLLWWFLWPCLSSPTEGKPRTDPLSSFWHGDLGSLAQDPFLPLRNYLCT